MNDLMPIDELPVIWLVEARIGVEGGVVAGWKVAIGKGLFCLFLINTGDLNRINLLYVTIIQKELEWGVDCLTI